MDVKRILADLRAEKTRITRAIAALDAISTDGVTRSVSATPRKRRRGGRMSAAGRRRLSELMKKRWAQGKMKRRAKAA